MDIPTFQYYIVLNLTAPWLRIRGLLGTNSVCQSTHSVAVLCVSEDPSRK